MEVLTDVRDYYAADCRSFLYLYDCVGAAHMAVVRRR